MILTEIQARINEIYHKLDNLEMESYDTVSEDYCCGRMDYDTLLQKAVDDYRTAKQVKASLSSLINEITYP